MQWKKFITCLGFLMSLTIVCAASSEHPSFLVISDIHLNYKTKHKMDFFPTHATVNNDLDLASFQELLYKIRDDIHSGKIDQPEFMIVLGDLVGHIRNYPNYVLSNEHIVFSRLKDAFPDLPILYSFGNDDSFTADYGVFESPNNPKSQRSPLDVMRLAWPNASFLSTGTACQSQATYPCLLSSNTSNGYYSAYVKPHLRLISLNSVMFSPQQSGYDSFGRDEQLKWLKSELEAVDSAKDSALIVMHIPPGSNIFKPFFWSNPAFWTVNSEQTFIPMITEHRLSIIGILAAHTHKDEIKVIHDSELESTGVYLNPALSTSHGNAPAVRSYTLMQTAHSQRWTLYDYQTYFFSRGTNHQIKSKLLYDFQAYYCGKMNEQPMADCLKHVDFNKIIVYLNTGNPSYQEKITGPDNIYINQKK